MQEVLLVSGSIMIAAAVGWVVLAHTWLKP